MSRGKRSDVMLPVEGVQPMGSTESSSGTHYLHPARCDRDGKEHVQMPVRVWVFQDGASAPTLRDRFHCCDCVGCMEHIFEKLQLQWYEEPGMGLTTKRPFLSKKCGLRAQEGQWSIYLAQLRRALGEIREDLETVSPMHSITAAE